MKKYIVIILSLLTCFALFAGDVTCEITASLDYPQEMSELSLEEKQLVLMDILTNISTQKGITYISKTAGYEPRTLILNASVIENIRNYNSKIDDPVITELTDKLSLNIFQEDNRFGKNTFTADYELTDNGVKMTINNYSPMSYLGITCVKANALTMVLEASCNENAIDVSASATVKNQKAKIKLLVYTIDIEDSFTRRITALKEWLEGQLNSYNF